MNKTLWFVVALVVLLILPEVLSAYTLKDTWHRSFEVAEGVEFILENVNGGIEIEGWERSEIDVHAEIKIKAPSKSKAEKLRKKLEFEVDAERDRVEISAKRPRIRQVGFLSSVFGDKITITIHYAVKVPHRASLDIGNTNGGIDVCDVEGTFECRTTNGGIDIHSFRGGGEARTVNGAIHCSIESLPPDGDLTLRTVNGGIDLRLPEDAGGELEVKTVNGGIDLDIDLRETIRIKRSSVKGVIGSGSGTVFLKTVNGGVKIEPY
jgi:DUF4097 and DUF4098 domain-containing protein YvlB